MKKHFGYDQYSVRLGETLSAIAFETGILRKIIYWNIL